MGETHPDETIEVAIDGYKTFAYSFGSGDEVLLCWRSDEPELLYYHGVDEGYAGRKPIPESCRC